MSSKNVNGSYKDDSDLNSQGESSEEKLPSDKSIIVEENGVLEVESDTENSLNSNEIRHPDEGNLDFEKLVEKTSNNIYTDVEANNLKLFEKFVSTQISTRPNSMCDKEIDQTACMSKTSLVQIFRSQLQNRIQSTESPSKVNQLGASLGDFHDVHTSQNKSSSDANEKPNRDWCLSKNLKPFSSKDCGAEEDQPKYCEIDKPTCGCPQRDPEYSPLPVLSFLSDLILAFVVASLLFLSALFLFQ